MKTFAASLACFSTTLVAGLLSAAGGRAGAAAQPAAMPARLNAAVWQELNGPHFDQMSHERLAPLR
jgi:hypothetical protein